MYKIEKHKYGLKITITGDLISDEIIGLTHELKAIGDTLTQSFSVLVDARKMMTLDKSVIHLAAECQRVVKECGRQYTAIVLNSPVIKNQVKRISVETGSTNAIRYIFADKTDDWEKVAMDWILRGKEPDPEFALSK
ncbi:MAG: hypothetical protein IIA17_02695 [candidate division Zixibacteria bacterium]|nr:hypothetical protein [candidate division Zixibacteria bacterium]